MYPVLEPHYELRLHPVEHGIIRRKGSDIRAPLNSVAMEILELCNGATSYDTICEILAKRHDDTIEHVKELTIKFLHDAVERKYVSFHEEPVSIHGLIVGSRDFFSPSHVGIELTHRCNLKCKHCYASATTHSKKQLSTADALVILEKLYSAGVASLMFTGGEATLHPGLFELLDYSMPRFERIQLFSNGWNINAQFAKKLLVYKPKIMVQISLDGKDAKTHDYIRGRSGSFDRVYNAIQMLTENQIHTVVAMLVTPFNKDQIEDVFLLSKKLGANEFRIGRITTTGRAEEVDWELSCKEFKEAGMKVNELSKKYGKEIYVERWDDSLITGEQPKPIENETKKEYGNNCGAGHRLINISPTGDIMPCSLLSEKKFKMGNILKQDLKTVFGSPMNMFFYRINTPNEQSCGTCEYWYSCKGCLFRGYAEAKKFTQCTWANKEIALLPKKK